MWPKTHHAPTLTDYLEDVAREFTEQEGLPSEIVEAARCATGRGMAGRVPHELEFGDQRRVRAYFQRVIRQRSVRATGTGIREFHRRAVAESIVRDLRESGREGLAIVRELERSYTGEMDEALIDEYRQVLCG